MFNLFPPKEVPLPAPPTSSYNESTVDYRRSFLRLANKLRRTRDRYTEAAARLRHKSTNPVLSDAQTNELLARAEQLDMTINDLNFMLKRAKWGVTDGDRETIDNGTI